MRISLNRRMDRLLDRLLPVGSVRRRLRETPPDMKLAYAQHRQAVESWHRRYTGFHAGAAYEAMLDGYGPPEMPTQLVTALWPNRRKITADTTLADAAEIYGNLLREVQS